MLEKIPQKRLFTQKQKWSLKYMQCELLGQLNASDLEHYSF